MTFQEMARAVTRAGGHWFDRATMRFFGTRLLGTGWLFVSSEQPPHGPRRYSVRRWDAAVPGDVDTVGEFCAYQTAR